MDPLVTYGGGRLLRHPHVLTILAHVSWDDGTHSDWIPAPFNDPSGLPCIIDSVVPAFLSGDTWQSLRQLYSRPGESIGNGTYLGMTGLHFPGGADSPRLDDVVIEQTITHAVNTGVLPAPSDDTVYVVVIQGNVTVVRRVNGKTSTSGLGNDHFAGYHSPTTVGPPGFYCVAVWVSGGADEVLKSITHELIEVVTNPVPGEGFTGPSLDPARPERQEICDYCDGKSTMTGGYTTAAFVTAGGVDGSGLVCGPDVAGDVPDIDVLKVLVGPPWIRQDCLGEIIEGQEVSFTAIASRRGAPAGVFRYAWQAVDQNGNTLVATEGHDGPRFTIDIGWNGTTSVHLDVEVVTVLGCTLKKTMTWGVVTSQQADEQNAMCAFIDRMRHLNYPTSLIHPSPLWEEGRDLLQEPLTVDELETYVPRIEALSHFAADARELVQEFVAKALPIIRR